MNGSVHMHQGCFKSSIYLCMIGVTISLLSNISWFKKQGMRLIPLTFRNEKV